MPPKKRLRAARRGAQKTGEKKNETNDQTTVVSFANVRSTYRTPTSKHTRRIVITVGTLALLVLLGEAFWGQQLRALSRGQSWIGLGLYAVAVSSLATVVPGSFALWMVPQGLSIPRHNHVVSGEGHFDRERWVFFFFLGAFGSLLVLCVEQFVLWGAGVRDEEDVNLTVSSELLKAFVVAGLCEEGFKALMAGQAARSVTHRILRRDEWVSEWVATSSSYSIAAALGLAATEAALEVIPVVVYNGPDAAFFSAFSRAIVAAPLHGTTGAYVGAYAAEMAMRPRHDAAAWISSVAKQLVVPLCIHGFYDLCHAFAAGLDAHHIGNKYALVVLLLSLHIIAASGLFARSRLRSAYDAASVENMQRRIAEKR
jgi:RsiW-degrading membrane proteinase PrsW (M82 family)